MSYTSKECPICSTASLVLVLYDDCAKACCENCRSRVQGVAQAKGVVFCPEQRPDGTWVSGKDVEFGEMRAFVDACLRPSMAGRLRAFLVSLPETILGVIELMQASIVAPSQQKDFDEARTQLESQQEQIDSLTQDKADLQEQVYDLARQLSRTTEDQKVSVREQMEILDARGRQVQEDIKQLGLQLNKAQEKMDDFFQEELPHDRKRIVERLLREYKAWRRGALAIDFAVPVRRVHWHILKPSGDSWGELVRYYENLSRNTGRRFDLERLRAIHDFKPDEIFVGRASFEGYVVFVFNSGNRAVLDCPEIGNALYMMEASKWKFLSQMSKTELLRFHREEIRRIVHYSYWLSDLKYFLRQPKPQ